MSLFTQMLMGDRKGDETEQTKQILDAVDRYGEWQGATSTLNFANDLLVNKFANVLSNKSSKEEFERRLAALQIIKMERELNLKLGDDKSKPLDNETLAAIISKNTKNSAAAQKVFRRIGFR